MGPITGVGGGVGGCLILDHLGSRPLIDNASGNNYDLILNTP